MAVLVRFWDNSEKRFDADSVHSEDAGRLVVLRKYARRKRRSQTVEVFEAARVKWARVEGGSVVFGGEK